MNETKISTENNVITLERTFDAPLATVWRAWTDAAILEQWWAPEPYLAVTKSMNFAEGGSWHYYMLSPAGEKHWCLVNYLEIQSLKNYKAIDAFCDENGILNADLPNGTWINEFSETATGSKVNISLTYPTSADVERITQMGFKEGITMTLVQLDKLLKNSFDQIA